MSEIRLLWVIIKGSGASKPLAGFLTTYAICALIVVLFEPSIETYGDALWFLWAVSTTIGLGDLTAVTMVGRAAAVVCSLYALITTAIITGVVVDFFNERRQARYNTSMSVFLDKLEHLEELEPEELAEMSATVRARLHHRKRA